MQTTGLEGKTDEELHSIIKAARRKVAIDAARGGCFVTFCKLMRPDPSDPLDSSKSSFVFKPHHMLLAHTLEKIERGELKRVAVSVAPQHGKSDLCSRLFIAFLAGRRPSRNVLFGTYSSAFACEFGNDVREIIKTPQYREVFPDLVMDKDTDAFLKTNKGGKYAFIGRGGAGTGKPADAAIIDDPLKNDEEASSELERRKLKKWFTKVVLSRSGDSGAILIIQTRWNEDDLIGWLCDPDHPDRKKDPKTNAVADDDPSKEWFYINIPAVVTTPELADALGIELKAPSDPRIIRQFGNKPMAALWPERFSLSHLARVSELDSSGFYSLYMGRATPEDGDYFRKMDLVPYYRAEDMPLRLNFYGASDHATSEKTKTDFTCLGCGGIDDSGDLWIPPDIVLERMETDRTVEEIIQQMQTRRPLLWWMEDEQISKSFGPFLRTAMREKRVYCPVVPVRPAKDKRVRARSIQGRIQLRTVHVPVFASWWPEAERQLLKFPYGRRDDFVDFLAHLGLGLLHLVGPAKQKVEKVVKTGTMAWVKAETEAARKQARLRANMR